MATAADSNEHLSVFQSARFTWLRHYQYVAQINRERTTHKVPFINIEGYVISNILVF
jgi:hypothetical protein